MKAPKWLTPEIIATGFLLVVVVVFISWMGCLQRWYPFTLIGCNCYPSMRVGEMRFTPFASDDVCPPDMDPPQSYPAAWEK